MTKIKKKAGWYRYSPPHKPYSPQKPEKTYETYDDVKLATLGGEVTFSQIEATVPVDVDHDQIIIKGDDGGEYGSAEITVYQRKKITREYPEYARRLASYEKDLKKYKDDIEKYKVEVKQWEEWEEQCKEEDLQRSLKHAEKLLRKHGKLK